MLKYPVYVRSVSNLSDARYCAGMGVDMLGFCLSAGNSAYVSPQTLQGILGWTAGVKWVAEFDEGTPFEEIRQHAASLQPDYICTPYRTDVFELPTPVIIKIDASTDLKTYPPAGSMLLLVNSSPEDNLYYAHFLKKELANMYSLFIGTGVTAGNVHEIFNVYKPYGISLQGGKEIAPGFKSFDELADVLEAIEIE